MTRHHRLVHAALWPALALVVALGFGLALYLRPPPPTDAPPMSAIFTGASCVFGPKESTSHIAAQGALCARG